MLQDIAKVDEAKIDEANFKKKKKDKLPTNVSQSVAAIVNDKEEKRMEGRSDDDPATYNIMYFTYLLLLKSAYT